MSSFYDYPALLLVAQFIVIALGVFVGSVLADRFNHRGKPGVITPTELPTGDTHNAELPREPIIDDTELPGIIVDTSAIIDGRIADIAGAGFIPGRLVIPRFVLAELQNIADSDDAMRRGRGRRGLEVLNRLRETEGITVEVTDEDVSSIKEVDAKLVALAQLHGINVLTTDYNLNRVAAIQGVRVLNVNELSNAIRPVVLPGEELLVRVVQPGKERNQGVGYLADGTMIVVENGDKLMGQEVTTEVTRVFQTVAGKMIFAVPRGTAIPDEQPADSQPRKKAPAPTPAVDDATPTDVEPKAAPARTRGRRGGRGRGSASRNLEDRIIAATNDQPHD